MRSLRSHIPREFFGDVRQTVCSLLNDSYYGLGCLRHAPADVAIAMFLLATLKLRISPSQTTPQQTWLTLLGIISPTEEKRIQGSPSPSLLETLSEVM